jgi:phosphoribosylamine--glycine ligase
MKYLVIGSGGREHCIAWRLLHDGSASEVFVAPGNGGIDSSMRVNIQPDDFQGITDFCLSRKIDMVVVGPEAPLAAGLVDHLTEDGIPAFGPTKRAAMLEGSKLFAKRIMEKYGIPTAGHHDFTGPEELRRFVNEQSDFPLVIKLDGLAGGKGVAIPTNRQEALDFINASVAPGAKVFVEDYLDGEEASILGISDGSNIKCLVAAQDHKRVLDGDQGPNTGGMGAYAPAPVVNDELLGRIRSVVMQPTIDGMKNEGIPFRGVLYAGLMIGKKGIKVLEFNARFGDPETQAVLPLLKGKLGDILSASVNGTIDKTPFEFQDLHAMTVVMASGGYPGDFRKGKIIKGLDLVSRDVMVFHAGTKEDNGNIVTSGGRVLNVTATGSSLREARDRIYAEIGKISFEDAFYRRDIGHRAL